MKQPPPFPSSSSSSRYARRAKNEQGSKKVGSEFLEKCVFRLSSIVSRRTKARRGRGSRRADERDRRNSVGPTPPRPAWTGKSSRKKKPSHAPTRPASRTQTHPPSRGKGASNGTAARWGQAILPSRGLWHQPRIGLMCDRGGGGWARLEEISWTVDTGEGHGKRGHGGVSRRRWRGEGSPWPGRLSAYFSVSPRDRER